MIKSIFNCRNLAENTVNELAENGFRIQVYHAQNDTASTNRIKVSTGLVELELLGLKNWGIPVTIYGQLHPLHGETSNIPGNEVVTIFKPGFAKAARVL